MIQFYTTMDSLNSKIAYLVIVKKGGLLDIRTNVRYTPFMATKNTKEGLLDAAEKLFAQEGYHGTSVRTITQEAGAHLASINYHFGSKEKLLKQVLERRLIPINQDRLRMLEHALDLAKRENRPPTVMEVVKAFADPLFTRARASDSIVTFANIVQISLAQHDSTVGAMFLKIMRPVIEAFIKALGAALPWVDDKQLHLKLHFMVGSMLHGMRLMDMSKNPAYRVLHKGFPTQPDTEALMEHMYRYIVAGLEAR